MRDNLSATKSLRISEACCDSLLKQCLQIQCCAQSLLLGGQVLCASNETHDKVVPLAPPATTPVGEKITFSG